MRAKHTGCDNLVQPRGFVDVHERRAAEAAAAAEAATVAAATAEAAAVAEAAAAAVIHTAAEVAVTSTTATATTPSALPLARSVHPVPVRGCPAWGAGLANSEPFVRGGGRLGLPADGLARGTLAMPRVRHVFIASTTARIRAYYDGLPEASATRRVVAPHLAELPSLFDTRTMEKVLQFVLTAGGNGLSKQYQRDLWPLLRLVDADARPAAPPDPPAPKRRRTRGGYVSVHDTRGGGRVTCETDQPSSTGLPAAAGLDGAVPQSLPFMERFPSAYSFVAAIVAEQQRVLSKLHWEVTPIEVEGVVYHFYSRDLLLAVLELFYQAENVRLWGGVLPHGPDGTRLRSCALDSDLFLEEEASVRRRNGAHAFVLAVYICIDEAVVSCAGGHYIYPIRVLLLNVAGGGSRWVTVGYVPHVPKPVGKTAAAKRIASDSRNALLQRCLAILLRRFAGASDTGVSVTLSDGRRVRAFPRVTGLVSDQLAERAVMCLMGHACNFFCTHCLVHRDVAGDRRAARAPLRDVVGTLDAQLDGAILRDDDPRPSQRNGLRTRFSALALVPALATVRGLATDACRLYDIVCFDILHVWKLGVVRMVAQRVPAFLSIACGRGGQARLGPVTAVLQELNRRAWELGYLCVPAPTPPG